jgi:hypothetical protein
MDKWASGIKELISFLADVLTVWVAVESLALFRDKKLPLFSKFRQMLDTYKAGEKSTSSPVQNTTIVPLAGTLCLNVFDTVNMGLNDGHTKLRFRQNVSPY